MEEKKCYKTSYKEVEKVVFKKERQEVKCPRKNAKRCEDGVLRYDDPKTNRKKGEPCKDDGRYN